MVFFGLTRIPQISQVLLLMVLNLTEAGGHFRPTRIPLFGWGLAHTDSTDSTKIFLEAWAIVAPFLWIFG